MNIQSKTQIFSAEIKYLPPLNDDEGDVSYNIRSLFTDIPVEETMNYYLINS